MIAVLAALAIAVQTVAPPSTEPIPDGYVGLIDDLGAIVVAVPETWTDVDTAPALNDDGTERPYIAASPDLESFLTGFESPGVLYAAFPFEPDPLRLIAQYRVVSGCETVELKTYDDPVFIGLVEVGTNCGPDGMTWNLVVANAVDQPYTALLQVQTAEEDELETIRRTFNYPAS